MKIQGAILREQSQSFAIVVVKRHLLDSFNQANETIRTFSHYFPGMPLVLAGQDPRGRFTYFGRRDISAFLASISPTRIPWKEFTFSN
jgi:hypothetical protein